MIRKYLTIINQLLGILSPEHKRYLLPLGILIFFTILLETIGIGLIIPLVTAITAPQNILSNEIVLKIVNNFLPFINTGENGELILSQSGLILAFGIFILFFFFIKNLFILYSNWIQNKKINQISLELSQKLYNLYLGFPFEFHTKTNKSVLYNNILHITTVVTGLEAFLLIIIEILVALGILALLLSQEFIGTLLILFILLVLSYFLYYFTVQNLANWGKKRFHFQGFKLKIVGQVLDGIKELKILNRNKFFFNKFSENESKDLVLSNYIKIISLTPRFFYEIVFILCIFLFLFYQLNYYSDTKEIIPILALYAAAFFRLLPSANRILQHSQRLMNISKIIKEIHEEFKSLNVNLIKKNNGKTFEFKKEIKIENLSFHYDERKKNIIKNLNLKINFGEQIGIIGESGSGKSTIINLLTGLLSPKNGSIKADDVDIENNISCWQKQIGYVPQDTFILDDTLLKNIALGITEKDILNNKIEQVLEQTRIKNFVNSLPKGLQTEVGEDGAQISGGQKQRIGIARALYLNPKLLILDEATSALDVEVESEILSEIKKLKNKITIIVISHRASALVGCDKIYKLEKGNLNLQ